MLKNYLKTVFRNLNRNKFYSFLSLLGLSVGMACSILILVYIDHELSFDRHHDKADRIYRIGAEYTIGGKVTQYANIARPVGPTLKQDYPEVLQFVRFRKYNVNTGNSVLINVVGQDDRQIEEQLVFYADSTLFEVFSYDLVRGKPRHALNRKDTAVLTQSTASKLFGEDDPIGKAITVDKERTYEITGVISDPPKTSHLNFEILLSWATFHSEADLSRWLGGHVFTYLLLPKEHRIAEFASKWPAFYEKYMSKLFERFGAHCALVVQPLRDIHLYSNLTWEVEENGSIVYVYVFAAIGLFLLVIACINYVNLATARSAGRALEVGIRKTAGALRFSLMKQFFVEALLLVVMAAATSALLARLLLPFLSDMLGQKLDLNFLANPILAAGFLGSMVFVSFLAGFYPALYLSAFVPARVLAKKFAGPSKGLSIRHGLVVLQFTISVAIIIATLIVREQLSFVKTKHLGFNREGVIAIQARGASHEKLTALRDELLQHPNITKAATSFNLPGRDLNMTTLSFETNDGQMEDIELNFMQIDHDFLDLMEIELVQGRNFDRTMSTDADQAVIVNHALVDRLGWKRSIGKKVSDGQNTALVIGVVNDFHMETLHNRIRPVVMYLPFDPGGWVFLRVLRENWQETLRFSENKWREFEPEFPISYVFVDENLRDLYEADAKVSRLFDYFSLLAIFISCLGLLGLSAFTAEQRTKEVGVRKVLGASVWSIVLVLSRSFLFLVVLANLIGWPLAYFFMQKWLQSFAYQTEIGWWIFALTAVIALLIAIVTMSFQAIRAAITNPIDSLRYE